MKKNKSKGNNIFILRFCVFLSASIGAFMLYFTASSLMNVMLDIKSSLNMGPITTEWMVTGFTAITCGLVCV